jgi:hypothetical protein
MGPNKDMRNIWVTLILQPEGESPVSQRDLNKMGPNKNMEKVWETLVLQPKVESPI